MAWASIYAAIKVQKAVEKALEDEQVHFVHKVETAVLDRLRLDHENEALWSADRECPLYVPGAAVKVDKQPS